MFRNPRETVDRKGQEALKPSIGRPPTPPSLTGEHITIASTTTTTPSVQLVTANSKMTLTKTTSSSRSPAQSLTQSKLSFPPGTSKAKSRPNQSILSFFKKVEPGVSNNARVPSSLFLEEQSPQKQNSRRFGQDGDEDGLYNDLGWDDEKRFNEVNTSAKKQKLSHPSEISDPVPVQLEKIADREQDQMACSPPPSPPPPTAVDKVDLSRLTKGRPGTRNVGPFIDESDSEAEELFLPLRETSKIEFDSKEEDNPDDIGLQPIVNGHEESAPVIPDLKREDTSYAYEDGFTEFEGLDNVDDEYPEGEEFVERQWMREQRRLEMIEAGLGEEVDEELDAPDFESRRSGVVSTELPSTTFKQETSGATCPICKSDLGEMSDQEASVHVNHCLDGSLPSLSENRTADETKDAPNPSSKKFKQLTRPARPAQESPFQLGNTAGTSSAFSKLMSNHAEDAAWATAAAAEQAARGKPSYQRTCPFYKILPGFFICVDAFRYGAVQGCNAYFLSHFHSDHYVGLTAHWCHGPIYCSRPTANLVRQQLRVDPKWVIDLEFEKKVEVPGTQGVFVTMIPANHCPGSSIYLFEKIIGNGSNPKVQRVLHCGDFRACPAHIEHPLLRPEVMDLVSGKTKQQRIDVCYLDTTYLNPRYAFPSQEDVIQACADMCVSLNKFKVDESDGWEQMLKDRAGGSMAKFVVKDADQEVNEEGKQKQCEILSKQNGRGRLLVIVGTYSIGKERICLGIARALGSKIYAPSNKQRICACLEDPELNSRLTSDPREAQVHMTPLFEIRAETLSDYLADFRDTFSRAVGFRPSGWNYRPPGSRITDSPAVSTVLYSDNWKSGYSMRDLVPQRGSTSRAKCFGVPYSEHSSFRELTMFCCALHIDKIIPTVNVGSAKSRAWMKIWCERWATERKKSGLFRIAPRPSMKGEKDDDLSAPLTKETTKNQWYSGKGTWELRTTL